MNTRFPLREKRKAQTRASLIKAAQDLFSRKGYDETTLEQIAGHAGLHVQTLYRHFSSKQDLATAGDQDVLDRFRQLIEDPAREGNTFEFWRAIFGLIIIGICVLMPKGIVGSASALFSRLTRRGPGR